MSSPVLGMHLSHPMDWWVGPRGAWNPESFGREQVRDHERGLDLTSTGFSTAVQGDSENQVLVLVERRR